MADILGISAFYHDSAACVVRDGAILAAAQEERFTRKKQDPGFPGHAIRYCLQEANCALKDLRYIVFYDKPLVKFERLLETYLSFAPRGRRSFVALCPVWLKEKLFLKSLLSKELAALDGIKKSALPPSCLPSTMRRTRPQRSSRPPSALRQSCAWTGSVSGPRRRPGWGTTISSPPVGHPLSPFARSAVLGIYLLHRIQGQFR